MTAQTKQRHTFGSDFRKFFFRGLAILLPSLVTLAIVFWAYNFLNNNIASPINAGVRTAVATLAPRILGEEDLAGMASWYLVTPEELAEARQRIRNPEISAETLTARVRAESLREVWDDRIYLSAIGFVVAIILVYLAGILVGNYLGRRTYQRLEGWLVRLPVIKQVYPNVKQVTDFLLGESDDKQKAKLPSSGRVVLVEYPRKGIWTVGLLTGDTMRAIMEVAGEPCVTVFIPSSPTPFTGYTITVPAAEVHELPISFDEAIRFVVSGGVLVPPKQEIEDSHALLAGGQPADAGEPRTDPSNP